MNANERKVLSQSIADGIVGNNATWSHVLNLDMEQDLVKERIDVAVGTLMRERKIRGTSVHTDACEAVMREWRTRYYAQPSVQAEMLREGMSRKMDRMYDGATETLEKWTARLKANPLDAFEWGDRAIRAAAELQAVAVLRQVFVAQGAPAAKQYAMDEAVRGARNPQHSTSVLSNEAKTMLVAVYAEFATSNF